MNWRKMSLVLLGLITVLLILPFTCQPEIKCTSTVKVFYLNGNIDTLKLETKRPALTNYGCIIVKWVDVVCDVKKFEVLNTVCK